MSLGSSFHTGKPSRRSAPARRAAKQCASLAHNAMEALAMVEPLPQNGVPRADGRNGGRKGFLRRRREVRASMARDD